MSTIDDGRVLQNNQIHGDFVMNNKMYGVYGINDKGFALDIYTSALRDELVLSRMFSDKMAKKLENEFIDYKKSFDSENKEMSMDELMTFLDNL